MKEHAQIAHQMPGRIRIKIPKAKGNPDLLEKVREIFDGIPGLKASRVKPDAGSIVLEYSAKHEAEFETYLAQRWQQVAELIPHSEKLHKPKRHKLPGGEVGEVAHKIEAEAEYLAGHSHTARRIVDFFKDADREIKRLSDNHIDLKIVLAVALAVATFIQIGAHAATPMWVTLALFAVNHFIEMQEIHNRTAQHPEHVPATPSAAAPAAAT